MLDRLAQKGPEVEEILPEQMDEPDRRQRSTFVIRIDVGQRVGGTQNVAQWSSGYHEEKLLQLIRGNTFLSLRLGQQKRRDLRLVLHYSEMGCFRGLSHLVTDWACPGLDLEI